MNVAIHYQVHDYEPTNIVIDTDKLDVSEPFLRDLKQQLEGTKKKDYFHFMAADYDGSDGDCGVFDVIENAKVKLPCVVDRSITVFVDYDC